MLITQISFFGLKLEEEKRKTPHLYFLYHLLAKWADFCGDGDGHILSAAVLAADAVERSRPILHIAAIQIRLNHRSKTDQALCLIPTVIYISTGLVLIILSSMCTAETYLPRIWQGKRHFVGPFHTALSALPSSLGICRRFAWCPLPLAGDRCMMGWSDRCVQTNVCCTVKRKSEHHIWLVLYKYDTTRWQNKRFLTLSVQLFVHF